MTPRNYFKTLLFILLAALFVSCEKNQPPTCKFLEPMNGSRVRKGDIVSISIAAEDSDGTLSSLRLYINEAGLASLEFPYQYELNTKEFNSGSYTLKASAKDNEGLESIDEITLIIDAPQLTVSTSHPAFNRYKSATLYGEVAIDGQADISENGFYLGTGNIPELSGTRIVAGSGIGNFSNIVNDLTPGETYYFSAFAVSEYGETLGEVLTFDLPDIEPGTFTDPRDQVEYGYVKIGEQVWMSENLKATLFNDGSQIPLVSDDVIWEGTNGAAYCWYDNNDQVTDRGALYNWQAVETQKLCPAGWHVPSDLEWRQFEYYLGMDESIALTDGFRGSNEGGMLKTTTMWDSPNTGATDEIQYSVVPTGRRGIDGEFLYRNSAAYFWLSDLGAYNHPLRRLLLNEDGRISRSVALRNHGLSVRCVKD